MTLKEIFYEYLDNQRMKEAICVLDNFVEDMRKDHHEEVEAMLCDVEETLNPYLDEEEAKEIVKSFENKDGSTGEKWSKSETDSAAHKYDVDLHSEKFNDWDWYAVLNMSYSDHYHQGWNTDVYVELAKDFLCDPDGSWAGKTKDYFEWKSNIS